MNRLPLLVPLLATPLLLSVALTAQIQARAVTGQVLPPDQTAPQDPVGQDPVGQDPAKQPAKEPTAEERLAQLKADKERLLREIEYAKARAADAKATLRRRLGGHEANYEYIDAGTSASARPTPPTPAPRKFARVATAEELSAHSKDALLLVERQEISAPLFDQVMNYLRQSPSSGDESLRAQRALFDLIRIEGVASAFPENEGEIKLGEALGALQGGGDLTELVQTHGTVQTGKPDGSVEVTRNSIHGPLFEQIAFSTEPGSTARPFRNASGYVLLHVDSLEKGARPELDKVMCHVVQIPYTDDQAALQQAQFRVNSGQLEVLTRDQETLDLLPALFKPAQAQPRPAVDRKQLETQIATIEAQILEVQKAGPDATEQLDMLKQQLQRMRAMLAELDAKTDADVDADADAKADADADGKSTPPPTPRIKPIQKAGDPAQKPGGGKTGGGGR